MDHPLLPDVASEQQPEPVPPEPDRLMADVDPALEQQSSTFRSDKGKRTYISTTSQMNSGDELKRRKGEGGLALDLRGTSVCYQARRGPATLA
jgi:hypothetical protein